LEIVSQAGDELERHGRVVMVIDGTDDFFGASGGADLAVGVPGVEQSEQAGSAFVVEAFISSGQQVARSIQRVDLSAPMPQGLVLNPASTFIDAGWPRGSDGTGQRSGWRRAAWC
jgi:hypothetical protein